MFLKLVSTKIFCLCVGLNANIFVKVVFKPFEIQKLLGTNCFLKASNVLRSTVLSSLHALVAFRILPAKHPRKAF